MKKAIAIVCCAACLTGAVSAQSNYGTTGLMNMPTADMQQDRTFMAGGNWLNRHTTVPRWWYDTWNYYINITIFPWLEVGYLCQGHKAVPTDYGNHSGYWVEDDYGRFVNQDRSFHVKLRLWKEGWWKSWTPQVVIGADDVVGDSWHGGSLTANSDGGYSNGFLNRYYLALSKHLVFAGVGDLGAHLSVIYCSRFDNDLLDPAVGANFRFGLNDDGNALRKLVNGITLMAELLPGYTDVNEDLTFKEDAAKYQFNVGLTYSCWKDHINAVFQMDRCKYPSVGLYFKLRLK